MEKLLAGSTTLDRIDDFIDRWHDGDSVLPIHKFLGLKREEYALWVTNPEMLKHIVYARKRGKPIVEAIEEYEALPMAARSNSKEDARRVIEWLQHTKHLD